MADKKFPADFLFGAATSAYQIEGAHDIDGKGPSVWDVYSKVPGTITGGHNGDIACDHYHRYKEDVALMKELGLQTYRFSVNWPRVLPKGRGGINRKGIEFYSSLIDELLKNGIEPCITLFHWETPQALMEKGGWANRDIVDAFREYSGVLFDAFGSRVRKWISFNENWVSTFPGYFDDKLPPRKKKDAEGALRATHNFNLAHAASVEMMRKKAPAGKMGTAQCAFLFYPKENNAACRQAAEMADGIMHRIFVDPVMKGTYPQHVLDYFKKNYGAGPGIKDGDLSFLRDNTADFLGANYYFSFIASPGNRFGFDIEMSGDKTKTTEIGWRVHPQGLFDYLKMAKKDYSDPEIYITENGIACKDDIIENGTVIDDDRIQYLLDHFISVKRAIDDGVKVKGYYLWSLMDNFEWTHGFTKRFGIIRTDYDTLKRSIKKSGLWYKNLIKTRQLPG